ncbi:hypothetical protein [Paenibacillus ginsengarvi]|uniref:Uncharacterized protein n=1 Tax=Paenibacillus ginsengarvi TaxID=400777 RepID=A0A3B0BR88_9BACL|nr:hypothetical protein [Paenibacillus ginsengarvi]RKN74991.1 hypothetical protein D7M11_25985 [Paenibacillus ginsengarvi]
MQIGRRIYYDRATGDVVVDTGERSGSVVETTVEQDFAAYVSLAERVPDTVGMIQLEYGQYTQDFAEASSYRVDLSGDEPALEFQYRDPEGNPEPEFRPPLSEEVADLKQAVAELTMLMSMPTQ